MLTFSVMNGNISPGQDVLRRENSVRLVQIDQVNLMDIHYLIVNKELK